MPGHNSFETLCDGWPTLAIQLLHALASTRSRLLLEIVESSLYKTPVMELRRFTMAEMKSLTCTGHRAAGYRAQLATHI
jgi:hypothetical protein